MHDRLKVRFTTLMLDHVLQVQRIRHAGALYGCFELTDVVQNTIHTSHRRRNEKKIAGGERDGKWSNSYQN